MSTVAAMALDEELRADELSAPEEGHIAYHGLSVFYRERGDGHPLLLINGLGGNVEMWAEAEARFSKSSRTVSFDAPGMGRSSTSHLPLPLPLVARIVVRLLDELGHERVDVVGYSLGGVMAQQLAHHAPHRIRRLALVGTSCGWGSAPPDALSLALISTPLRYLSPRVYRATSHLLDGGDRFRDPALKQAQAEARNSHPPSLVGYAQQFLQGTTWSSLHWVSHLSMPTLVLSGERDRLVPPANGLLLANRLPNSRLHVLPGEGHLMLFDPDSAALPLLEEFFTAADHESSGPWRSGAQVNDGAGVQEALAASHGAEPMQSASRIYRAWVGSPLIRTVFR